MARSRLRTGTGWYKLPTEMKSAILKNLEASDLKTCQLLDVKTEGMAACLLFAITHVDIARNARTHGILKSPMLGSLPTMSVRTT
jgi:hypothetical protein